MNPRKAEGLRETVLTVKAPAEYAETIRIKQSSRGRGRTEPAIMCKVVTLSALILLALSTHSPAAAETGDKPNILFIAIDDLNDWVEPLAGHPQALTPNLDAFAAGGSGSLMDLRLR
jgi:hypothetical protein